VWVVIRPVSGAGPVAGGRSGPREAGGFRVPKGGGGASAAGAVSGVQEVGLGGMLALQEAPDEVADREARRRGHEMLEALAALQRSLLGIDGADPARLARLSEKVPEARDPALREAVAAIALRARIEAVRLELGKEAAARGDGG
jgi:hypothetical protein